jgi:hypothetical protein
MNSHASGSIGLVLKATGALLALAPLGAAMAQGAHASSAVELARQADQLKPGDWVWAPEIASAGPVTVYVDLSDQIATVYRNGVRIGVSTVSSGKPGHETPTGVFTILQKDARHRSSTYNNAPMPYQERLTWDGVALHAGGLPGYPESHGCIHLPMEFARLLFGITDLGGTVVVAGAAGQPLKVPGAGVLDGIDGTHRPLAANEPFRWTPDLSPSGPLTIVLSRTDQRVVVLRNGIEIGRARIEVPTDTFETHVLTYTTEGGKGHWIYLGVPGHDTDQGTPLDTTVLSHVRMPSQFLADVKAAVVPGTTVLVTNAAVLPQTTGRHLTVLATSGAD